MKKIWIFHSIIFIFFLTLGYSIFFSKEKEDIKIIMLRDKNENLKSLIQEYSKKNNINIIIEETDFFDFVSGIEEKHMKNEDIADIFLVINDWIGDLAQKNIIEEVRERDIKNIIKEARESVKYKNKYYAYPYKIETLFLFYNKKYIKNIPNKIEDILNLSNELKKNKEIEGLIFPIDEFYYHFPWYSYVGGEKEDLLKIDNNTKEKLKKELNLIKDNFIYTNVFVANLMFESEEAAMMINGNWEIDNIDKYNFETGYGIIKDERFKQFAGTKSFAIYKKSQNKKEARKILKYLITYEAQKKINETKSVIPVNEKLIYNSDKKIVVNFKENINHIEFMPNEKELKEFWLKSNLALNKIFWENCEVEETIENIFGE